MKLRARVITMIGHEYSEACAARCISSGQRHGVEVERFPATQVRNANLAMFMAGLKWTFPLVSKERHHLTGLWLRPYNNRDLRARIGCAMSHCRLWEECAAGADPYLVLEHDAVFVGPLPDVDFRFACMVNDPLGATPKGRWWSKHMRQRGPGVFPVTHIFPNDIPDGLAGNSAYLLQPHAASALVNAYRQYGVWPNDATMCRQLFPDLEELYPFVTRVERGRSTTAT